MKEDGYLKKYTPGNFEFTFLLSSGKFNEADMNLVKHLIFNPSRDRAFFSAEGQTYV